MANIPDPVTNGIPTEITSTIFEFVFSYDADACATSQYEKTPLLLGAVSRQWRRIAWSTPRLWLSVTVRLNSQLLWQAETIGGWISRSGNLPLTLLLYHRKYEDEDSLRHSLVDTDALVRVLNSCSHRWKTLELRDVPLNVIQSLRGNGFSTSILRNLFFRYINTSFRRYSGQGAIFQIQNAVIRPDYVAVTHMSLDSMTIDWSCLTRAFLDDLNIEDYFEVLRGASRLKSLELTLTSQKGDHELPAERVVHIGLMNLTIHQFDRLSLKMLLHKIALPALVNLEIIDDNNYPELRSLSQMLRTSGCQLQRLCIRETYHEPSDILAFLESTPSLRHLELLIPDGFNGSANVLVKRLASTWMISGGRGPAFLPNLACFKYDLGSRYCSYSPFMHEDQFDYRYDISDRDSNIFPWRLLLDSFGPPEEHDNPHRRPLHEVSIVFEGSHKESGSALGEEHFPTIRAILEAGLRLEVAFSDGPFDLHRL